MVDKPRQPEVSELGVEGRVQRYVGRLNVPVQNALVPLFVQVQNYTEPKPPSILRASGSPRSRWCQWPGPGSEIY